MENIDMCLLYDFFGELLTERQQKCFELHYNNDLSLTEIGEIYGISRQGAFTNVSRARDIMLDAEKKTGIVARFLKLRGVIEKLESLSESCNEPRLFEIVTQLKGLV
jgi:predicted DNA-binding protein YlxM (UPF0122 family)